MAFFHALGLGIAIIVLRILAPEIWSALEHLAIDVLTVGGEFARHLQAAAAAITLPQPAL